MAELTRIVVMGKTGAGKSSLAKTIFGGECVFEVNTSANSGTKICQSDKREVNGRRIQLIDTPGLFDTDPNSSKRSPELLRCMTECAPGPHAFLIVLKVEKYTTQEQAVVALILKYFSEEALKYTTVVFTHGDDLPDGMRIREWINENEALRNLVDKCGGRCHVFDNKYWNNSQHQYRNNQVQVKELLETIDKTVKENGGGYYTNEMLQNVNKEIQKKVDLIIASSPNTSMKDILKKAKELVYSKLNNNIGGAMIGVVAGALLGAVEFGAIQYFKGDSGVAFFAAATRGVAVGGIGGFLWAWSYGWWSPPPVAVRHANVYFTELEDLFEQVNRIRNAPLAMLN